MWLQRLLEGTESVRWKCDTRVRLWSKDGWSDPKWIKASWPIYAQERHSLVRAMHKAQDN